MKRMIYCLATVLSVVVSAQNCHAITVRLAAGPNAAAIQGEVDAFRSDLGVNNGVGPCTGACVPGVGRREINWDAVPDAFASSDSFPGDFFNLVAGSPVGRVRGARFVTTGLLEVSADSDSDGDGNPGPVSPLFGNHSFENSDDFAAFSPERIFGLVGTNQLDVLFDVPGAPGTPATVRGFGAVFTDVEVAGSTKLDFYDAAGDLLHSQNVPAFESGFGVDTSKSLSFLGVSFDTPKIARVHITNGGFDLDLELFGVDDAAAMDDFIFGEPAVVPEPTTGCLISAGFVAVAMLRRRSVLNLS